MSKRKEEPGQGSWTQTTLGKALPLRYGKARSERHGMVRENTAVYGSSGVIDTFNRALTSGPTLIIGRKGTVGATHYSPTPCWPIDTVYFTEADTDKDLRFFKYLLDHLQLGKMDRSTAVPGLSRDDYNAKEVFIPPLDEQREIVAEIEKQFTRLEAGVAGLRRVQANLKRYRAAVLKAACEGKLVPTEAELARQRRMEKVAAASRRWPLQENQSRDGSATQEDPDYETGAQLLERILRERRQKWSGKGKYKEPAQPDTAKLPALPVGWVWTTMDVVIISGPQNGIYLPKASYGRGCPILRIDDFQEGWVRDRDELNMVTGDPETLKVYQLRVGDLVINRVNSPSHLGKCLVVRDSLVPAVFESNMMRAVLSGLIHTRYVEFYLRSVDGRSRLNSNAKWAVNQASINQEDVKSTALPLPPVPEQERIVAEVERRLSVVEEIEAVVNANLQRVTRLRQSILQRFFQGSTNG